MKTFVLLALFCFAIGCSTEKEIQASFEDVELVKIDTISRYPNVIRNNLPGARPVMLPM